MKIILIMCVFLMGCSSDRGSEIHVVNRDKVIGTFFDVNEINGCPYVVCKINGIPFKFLLDTGSTGILITSEMMKAGNAEIDESAKISGTGVMQSVKLKVVKKIDIVMENGLSITASSVGLYENSDHGILPYKILTALPMQWDITRKRIYIVKSD